MGTESQTHPGSTIIVLAGPTAVGKTAVAVELCEKLGGEIVGADSVQVYRGLDIGSAKPGAETLRGVRHHMIDVVDPDQYMDAATYARLADDAIASAIKKGAVPVVVGGTGLWIRALLRGLVKVPPVDEKLRARLTRQWEELGAIEMHRRLNKVDPDAAAAIHPHDRMRVVRALEVHEQTGRALGELRREHALGVPRYRTLVFYLDIPTVHLRQRLADRTRAMIEAGWAEEVRGLINRYGSNIRPLESVGYRQMAAHIVDAVPMAVTEQKIIRATRTYVKRQRTWFKSDPDIDLQITPEQSRDDAVRSRIDRHLKPNT